MQTGTYNPVAKKKKTNKEGREGGGKEERKRDKQLALFRLENCKKGTHTELHLKITGSSLLREAGRFPLAGGAGLRPTAEDH